MQQFSGRSLDSLYNQIMLEQSIAVLSNDL